MQLPLSGVKQAVDRILTGSATPVRMAPHRVTRIWEEPFCAQLKKLKEAKLITLSASAWAAPMFAVPKNRRLNNNTDPDPYYQPYVDETLHRMAPARYFNMFDMARGFYQIPIAPEDREKTMVLMPVGKFMFNVMPFGLRNSPATFQRLMDDVLRDCTNFVHAYIDDVAIFCMT